MVKPGYWPRSSKKITLISDHHKESMCLVLHIIASSKWLCWSIDIKSPFLQNKNIELFTKPPKEADCQDTTLWKLNTTIYRLNDASRIWYPAVFIWHNNSKVNGLLCTHVDNFFFGETELVLNKVINPITCVFTIGSGHCAALKYLGLNIIQSHSKIIIDQVNYIKSINYIAISNDRKKQKDDLLFKEENDNIITLERQLG